MHRTAATRRGTTRYLIGLVASVVSASICSVTRIVPISAAMAGGDAAGHHQSGNHRPQLARDAEHHDLRHDGFGAVAVAADIDLERQHAAGEERGETHDRQGE